jgi:hypothetical protein
LWQRSWSGALGHRPRGLIGSAGIIYRFITLYGAARLNRDSLDRNVCNCMDLNKLDELSKELERAALAVERCEKELAEVRKDGIADDEFEKLDEINATLAAAAERFEAVTMELKRLSKNKS